jgi:hypothetical protein
VKWEALKQRVPNEVVRRFEDVQVEWLDLMWTLDSYRKAGVAPSAMGKQIQPERTRLEAINKGKGNWFATLLALILENQTDQKLAPRSNVAGFSQSHQIDIAWPDRKVDPLICLETKVTGAGPSPSTGARGAMDDWTNRRKELKFAATDLKLNRRQHETVINHWDVWREHEAPKTYFLWAARLGPKDRIDRMVKEAQALVKTYLDGAGVVAWQEGDGRYELVGVPPTERVSDVDDVLYRIASEIKRLTQADGKPPAPVVPLARAVAVQELTNDS